MARARDSQRSRDAQGPGDAVEVGRAVEVDILARVDDVESRNPEQHRRSQEHGGPCDGSAQGDPGGSRRHAERKPEPEMRQAREPFAVGVTQQPDQHWTTKIKRPPIRQEKQRGRNEGRGAHNCENRDFPHAQPARGKMPARGARIPGIELPVNQPIESHRRRARRSHTEENAHPVLKPPVPASPIVSRQHGPQQRKWQREERMAELDEIKVFAKPFHVVVLLQRKGARPVDKLES